MNKRAMIATWLVEFIKERENVMMDWEYSLQEADNLLSFLSDEWLLEDDGEGEFEGEF